MNNIELYKPHIESAANKYAFNIAANKQLRYGDCYGFKLGIQTIAQKLVEDGIIEPEKLYEYLNEKYKHLAPKEWWINKKSLI